MSITTEPFGFMPNGTPITLYRFKNQSGMTVTFTNIGASIVSILVPDKNGSMRDVVLGYATGESYLANEPYMGCIVARNVNRIYPAEVTINNIIYPLSKNHGETNLHTGGKGTYQRWFHAKLDELNNSIAFTATI